MGVAEEISLEIMATPPKRPRDSSQLAKFIVEIAIGERPNDEPKETNEAAKKRGVARAAKLTSAQRRKIAKKAAAARWGKNGRKGKGPRDES